MLGSVDRRRAMLASMMTGAGLMLPLGGGARAARRASGAGTSSTPPDAIVSTRYGPVRGYVADDVYTFKGIPYGADTGGENRWLPAKPPKHGPIPIRRSPMARTVRRRCTTSALPSTRSFSNGRTASLARTCSS